MTEIQLLGKLNRKILERVFGNLQTNEIIITSEREKHIKERHSEDYNLFQRYGKSTVNEPDYIIQDTKNV